MVLATDIYHQILQANPHIQNVATLQYSVIIIYVRSNHAGI